MSILAAASLAGNYEAGPAIVAGLIGGIAFLLVVYISHSCWWSTWASGSA